LAVFSEAEGKNGDWRAIFTKYLQVRYCEEKYSEIRVFFAIRQIPNTLLKTMTCRDLRDRSDCWRVPLGGMRHPKGGPFLQAIKITR